MKKIFLTTLLIGGLFISSCNDFLEVLPKDKQATDTYWESASDVESILGQGYSTMRLCVPKMLQWGELRGSSVTTTLTKGYMIQNFQVLPGNDFVKWMDFYKVINLANSVLENAPGVMDKDESYKLSQMNSHLTEAYFMRGLMYLYLVRNFQEVPLLTKAYIDDTMPNDVPKSSEKEIIDQIKEDVKAALATGAAKEMFEESWANKGRATKWALYALMAETCLWAEDYDECITYADYLINATSARRPVFMSIPTQWFQMFYPGNSNESIFEIQYNGAVYQQTTNSPCKIFTYSSGDESPEYCRTLHSQGIRIIKAFSIALPKDLLAVFNYEGFCDYYLFDTRTVHYGGSGQQFDWSILQRYTGSTPFLLSGGINSYSVKALKEFHHPRLAGIDINSRFETSPGIKDVERIERFLKELRTN